MTPQNLLGAPATPGKFLASSSTRGDAAPVVPSGAPPVYAPCPSPAQAPPSPALGPASMAPVATPHSMETAIVPQLQNIVSTVSLCCKLDLKKIALQARNAEYNPKRFAAVIMRIREPRTTALIFR